MIRKKDDTYLVAGDTLGHILGIYSSSEQSEGWLEKLGIVVESLEHSESKPLCK